jgi:hypothetical protein
MPALKGDLVFGEQAPNQGVKLVAGAAIRTNPTCSFSRWVSGRQDPHPESSLHEDAAASAIHLRIAGGRAD